MLMLTIVVSWGVVMSTFLNASREERRMLRTRQNYNGLPLFRFNHVMS